MNVWQLIIGGSLPIITLIVQQIFAQRLAKDTREADRARSDSDYERTQEADRSARQRAILESLHLAIDEHVRELSVVSTEMSILAFTERNQDTHLERAQFGRLLLEAEQRAVDKLNVLLRIASLVDDPDIRGLTGQIRVLDMEQREKMSAATLSGNPSLVAEAMVHINRFDGPTTAMTDRVGELIRRL